MCKQLFREIAARMKKEELFIWAALYKYSRLFIRELSEEIWPRVTGAKETY